MVMVSEDKAEAGIVSEQTDAAPDTAGRTARSTTVSKQLLIACTETNLEVLLAAIVDGGIVEEYSINEMACEAQTGDVVPIMQRAARIIPVGDVVLLIP